MRIVDYLPHRLLANHFLRIEGERYRADYEKAKKEYEENRQKCIQEIEAAEEDANKRIENAVHSINKQLSADADGLQSLRDDLRAYTQLFFKHRVLITKCDSYRAEKNLLVVHRRFLERQMSIIGEEVDELEKLKDNLAQRAGVDDIIELLSLSGFEVPDAVPPSAKSLLNWTNAQINQIEGYSIEKATLKKLKRTIQEREDLVPVITYIGWVIEQKINLSKECKRERDGIYSFLPTVVEQLQQCEQELVESELQLNQQAQNVRYYWAKPLMPIQAAISYLSTQKTKIESAKKELIREIKPQRDEKNKCWKAIQEMKAQKSDDDYKWRQLNNDYAEHKDATDKLQKEIDDCVAKTKSIDLELQKKQDESNYWEGIANRIYDLQKSNHARLVGSKRGIESDEFILLCNRLSELEEIAAQDEKSAKEKHDADVADTTDKKDAALGKIAKQISWQDEVLRKADSAFKAANSSLIKAQEEDKKSRNTLARILFKSDAVKKAEKWNEESAVQKQQALDILNKLQEEYIATEQWYDQKIQDIPLIRTRPTCEEKVEREKLEIRKAYLLNSYARTRRGKANESKD